MFIDDKPFPPQSQERPGVESAMDPPPRSDMRDYRGSGKLAGRRALVTGGDSGIGRAVSVAFAKEGADVAVAYLDEDEDAERTAGLINEAGRKAQLLRTDLSSEENCEQAVQEAAQGLGGLDVLVLHHGTQFSAERLEDVTTENWETTIRTNLTSFFWIARAALRDHLQEGASIIMTGSVNGFRGNSSLIDYAASKGGIHMLALSLSQNLQDRGIRVNVVAPGPVWTPLIPATLPEEKVASFGTQAPIGRAAQPDEIAPSYVFLASNELSGFYTGQTLAPIGGEIHPG